VVDVIDIESSNLHAILCPFAISLRLAFPHLSGELTASAIDGGNIVFIGNWRRWRFIGSQVAVHI